RAATGRAGDRAGGHCRAPGRPPGLCRHRPCPADGQGGHRHAGNLAVKQVLVRRGQTVLEDVPAPMSEPGTLLIQVRYSCISTGTEISGIQSSGVPLWKQALQQPEKLRKAVALVAREGIKHVYNLVQSRREAGRPCGYSAAGVVREVGPDITGFRTGD